MTEATISANPARRLAARSGLVATLVAGLLAGVPPVRSSAVPATVVRSRPLEASSLAAGPAASRIRLDLHGSLRAGRFTGRTAAETVCAPIWFDGVAVTWTRASGRAPEVLVRTGDDAASLEHPTSLDPEGGADPGTPDHRGGSGGSTFLWTGGSRCAEISLDIAARSSVAGLRVVFVNSSGTSAGPTTGPPQLGPISTGFLPIASADARTARPRIITRDEWGANPRLMNCTPDVADFLDVGFVHHTAGPNAYSRAQADDVVRGVYAYHTQGRGWCDIGYNFLVDRFGDVFEGRSGGVTENVIGAAQMGFNTGAFSVALMGTFDASAPPRAVVRALTRLLAWRLDIAHVYPRGFAELTSAGGRTTRYSKGTVVRLHVISGHRDTGLTSCPGASLYRLLPRIRRVVGRLGLPKIYEPRLSETTFVAGRSQRLRVGARASSSVSWSVTVLGPDGARVTKLPVEDGERLALWWRPAFDVPGRYRVVIAASDARGRPARPAELGFVVEPRPPDPSPSPSPSETVTASPSASPSA